MEYRSLAVESWPDYELIDSGDNRKLERYGKFTVIRPETQALWQPRTPDLWKRAQAEFRWAEGKGSWQKKSIPEEWEMSWRDARFTVRLTSFKHTGVFPEQAANWEWVAERVQALHRSHGNNPAVLNLFGYTGIASIVAAKHGAHVTHVDASKQSNTWAKNNAMLSGCPETGIRYITDDALKFAEREVRRGASYDGIILDPPAFGRGAKGEVWRIEEHLPRLMAVLEKLLGKKPGSFFLLNGYAAGYSPISLLQATESAFGKNLQKTRGSFGELLIREAAGNRHVPSGIYVRFGIQE